MCALGDRPVTLQRFPDGIDRRGVLTKNPPKGMPDWVRPVMCTYPSGAGTCRSWSTSRPAAVWAVQMNTVTFHPWPVRTARRRQPRRAAHRPRPAAGAHLRGRGRGGRGAARAAHRDRAHRVGPRRRGNRGRARLRRGSPRPTSSSTCGTASSASRRELERRLPDLVTDVVVEGGARRADLRRLQPGLPRPHHRVGLQPAPAARRAGVDAGRPGTQLHRRRARATSPCAPCRASLAAAVTRGPTSTTRSATSPAAIALWDKDVDERGLGELNFPPDYPKMPGEPPRVQPSKRRTDKSDADYMAPKAERDAELRSLWGAGRAAGAADARQAGQGHPRRADYCFEPKWDGFRSIIFRVRRRGRDRQPQREADDPLLPRGGRGGAGQLPGAVRRRRRDRAGRRRRGPARLRGAPAAHPPGRQPGEEAGCRDARRASSPSTCWRSATTTSPGGRSRERRPLLEQALADARPPIHLTRGHRRPPTVAQEWFEQFEGAGLDGVVAKPLDVHLRARTSASMLKIKHERTADCVVAGYRTHKSGTTAIGSLLLGLYDDDGSAAERRRHRGVPDGPAQGAVRRAAAAGHRLRRPPVGLGQARRWARRTPTSGAEQPVERRQGPVVHPAAPRARGRGALRPHGGHPVPAHRPVRPLARRTGTRASCTYDQLEEPVSFDLADVLGEVGQRLMTTQARAGAAPRPRKAAIRAAITGGALRRTRVLSARWALRPTSPAGS